MTAKTLLSIGLLFCASIGIGWFIITQPKAKDASNTSLSAGGVSDSGQPSSKTIQLPPGRVIIGGIERPDTDVQLRAPVGGPDRPTPKKPEGAPPIVAADKNPQVALVQQALKSGEHPERYSSFVIPASFKKDAYNADPKAYAKSYAETVEPGRVFVTAQPADGVPALRSVGSRTHHVTQGESVRLVVAASPNAPVTFTSFGMGHFENSLTTITVVAGEDGKAVATFTASSGTKNEVSILAASPVLTEQVNFSVSVKFPNRSTAS